MKHLVWKKVKIMPALMDVFVCQECMREKGVFSEDRCKCDDFRRWEEIRRSYRLGFWDGTLRVKGLAD